MTQIQTTMLNTFGGKGIDEIKDEVKQLYTANDTPWVIGYSGGKDSTAVVQLIYLSLLELPEELRRKTIYVLSSDTKVETPAIVNHLDINLEMIQAGAKRDGLPIETIKVEPTVSNTFWVNLLGRGYPAPTQSFRWCTDRMKIQPANKFISDQVSRYGEVILVLGVRSDESAARAKTINKNKNKYDPESLLSRHSTLSGARVYSPVKDFTTDDIWTFLLQYDSPWGYDNNSLLTLYRSANAGECPLVVDSSTQSCGNSRFGCWTCTVVTKDKALEAIVENGEDWLEPLLDFRDFLATTQTPEGKKKYRSHKRRTGQVNWIVRKTKDIRGGTKREEEFSSSEMSFGPYKFECLKDFMKELLITEKKVNDVNPTDKYFEVISIHELEEIRKLWRIELQDWEDSLPKIYQEALGKEYPLSDAKGGGFSGTEFNLLAEIAEKHGQPAQLIAKLLDTARAQDGLKRRNKALSKLESVIKEEWRDKKDILASRVKKHERRGLSTEVQS
jgi:DNA sulfur modification protein DndC